LVRVGGVHDDGYRSFLRAMTPIADQAATAQSEWQRGSEALLAFNERLERVMLDGGISSLLRVKIAEIDTLIVEQQAGLGAFRECRISSSGSGDIEGQFHDSGDPR
jgi:hypothetical protein